MAEEHRNKRPTTGATAQSRVVGAVQTSPGRRRRRSRRAGSGSSAFSYKESCESGSDDEDSMDVDGYAERTVDVDEEPAVDVDAEPTIDDIEVLKDPGDQLKRREASEEKAKAKAAAKTAAFRAGGRPCTSAGPRAAVMPADAVARHAAALGKVASTTPTAQLYKGGMFAGLGRAFWTAVSNAGIATAEDFARVRNLEALLATLEV
ncbi:hypothetical protein M885DRAFT_518235, partial [Pelagophyceae sp. CCMP2097]